MRTGQAVYVEIDSTGRLMAQDPKALSFSVAPINYNTGLGFGTTGGAIPSGTTPVGTTPGTTQSGGMWGGLLKQGVQSIMNKQQQGAAPLGGQ